MRKIKEILSRFWSFVLNHRWSVLLLIIAIIVGGFFIWDALTAQGPKVALPGPVKKKKIEKVRAPLSGRMVEPAVAKIQPIGVVIENHPDARPQSGLNEAALIFETYAEGGITRFLAFYQDQSPKELGPVRSAREYFVEWANAYRAPLAHVGGSSEATNLINKLKVYDLNQFFLGNYFWRANNRYAPHNVYTTLGKLFDASKTKGYPTENSNIPSFSFKDDIERKSRPQALSFTVGFNQTFAVTWKYDPELNSFTRIMSGIIQTDSQTKEAVKAKNVIVCFSDISFGVSDISGQPRSTVRTTGGGKALFYVDGQKTTGTWKRLDGQTTKFYAEDNKELKLNAGTTWVEFVPIGTIVN